MSLWTIIPIRGLAAGKTRLAGVLDAAAREALTTRMFDRTLRAIVRLRGSHARTLVACAQIDAFARACAAGAQARLDTRGATLNEAVRHACTHARALGASRVMIVAADLPWIDAAALQRLEHAAPAHTVALLADKHGSGTNGLVVPLVRSGVPAGSGVHALPDVFAFGAHSLRRHRERFAAAGWPVVVVEDPDLGFDVDTPEDYRALAARAAELSRP